MDRGVGSMMNSGRSLFTSESVTEGHPDKICDQISDAILDACLMQDPQSRTAIETVVKTGMVLVVGELTTRARINIPAIVRRTLLEIGYTNEDVAAAWLLGFGAKAEVLEPPALRARMASETQALCAVYGAPKK